jgi:thiosulfate dehydrogenase [quinone] large subunit
LRVLRAFLGVTFAYAGVQKLADPGYLSSSEPTFIGTQLKEFSTGSPIAWLLHPLMQHAVAVGVAVAVIEIAIGIGTLAAIAPLTMAFGGGITSLALWLSATWHVHPYFLGSDSIYAVAWTAYALSLLEVRRSQLRAAPPGDAAPFRSGIDRRAFLRSGALVAGVMSLGGLASLLRGRPRTGDLAGNLAAAAPRSASPRPSVSAVDGKPIVALDKLRVGRPVAFTGPSGEPAALFRLSESEIVAYSRICTHAGCTVGYDRSSNLLVCPCHLARFDPDREAQAVSGPTSIPLPKIDVAIDDSTGMVVTPQS